MKALQIVVGSVLVAGIAFLAQDRSSAQTAPPSQQQINREADVKVAIADEKKSDGNSQKEERSLDKFMYQKLDRSSFILRGLMTEDFKLISENADKLLEMSHEEQWRASNDMMYLQHSGQFRSAVEDLRNKAEKHNIDGASLAWINVTMSCMQCHRWVRNVILADVAEGGTSELPSLQK